MSHFAHLKKNFFRLDKWLDTHLILIIPLLLLTVLRLPNFFEPYWYGDEGIYLTIGKAMNYGQRLYADIVDHKTPLIYYLARVPDQFSFRVLLFVWMLATTTAFYNIAKMFIKNSMTLFVTMILFVVFTTLPWLEGHIPNGELFVMGFILTGGWLFLKHFYKTNNSTTQPTPITIPTLTRKTVLPLFGAGLLFGLGLLTKVPALFDAAAFFAFLLFVAWHNHYKTITNGKSWKEFFAFFVSRALVLGIGFITPLLLSIFYFYAIGAGTEYLNFGLLYNFHYSGTWQLGFDSPLLTFLFTLMGKFIILAVVCLVLLLCSPWLGASFQFTAAWFALALFASLLSNRPYPHYFLQVVPPAVLFIGMFIENTKGILSKYLAGSRPTSRALTTHRIQFAFTVLLAFIFIKTLFLLDVRPYETAKYYNNWFQYMTKSIDRDTFYGRFNGVMADNYDAAKIIARDGDKEMFIWGTNPMLYALSDTIPTGRFTVAFHITDLNVFDETYADLVKDEPTFIVVMKNEGTPFPELYSYIDENYVIYKEYNSFTLFRKLQIKQ